MTGVNPRFGQSSAGGFDDLDGLLRVQRGPKSRSGRNETKIFAAVVEPERDMQRPSYRHVSKKLNVTH